MISPLQPVEQVEIAYAILANALLHERRVISETEAEKWLDFLRDYAKYGAAIAQASQDNTQATQHAG